MLDVRNTEDLEPADTWLVAVPGDEPPQPATALAGDRAQDRAPSAGYDGVAAIDFAHRVLQVAERVAIGGLLLLTLCALLAARFGAASLPVRPLPLAAWGLAAAVSAVALAALARNPHGVGVVTTTKRRVLGAALMAAMLVSVTGVVANADGAAGPAWVLFLPVVVVCGAVLGPLLGLGVGALAAAGLYAATGISGTLDSAGLGRLVMLLPALPALGGAAGALAGAAHEAVAAARRRSDALERDVALLADLLESVAAGDLTRVPSLEDPADSATATLAVVFADTLLSLRRLVRQLTDVADQLASSSHELAATAGQHVGAVEQQASAVSETTSTIEQLAATATVIAETAVRVGEFAADTRRDVDAGAVAVTASTAAMQAIGHRVAELGERTGRLDERVRGIATTTRVIDDIARRTTMLGLNASIEAARSGESGQGFATVAAEIGTLASRAREATAGISRILAELEAEVAATAAVNAEGAVAVNEGLARQRAVDHALSRISDMVDQTTRATHDITSATSMQRQASEAVVAAMHSVTTASDQARSATRGHADSAGRLRDLAASVRAGVGRFRVQ